MISGFNTDISHNGVVYHVQTEDKGLSSRLIVSLVYDKGTILASKRVKYDDLAGDNYNEKELTERLSRQHNLICAALKAGRLEELKKMSKKAAPTAAETGVHVEEKVGVTLGTIDAAPKPVAAQSSVTLGRIETTRVIKIVPPVPAAVVEPPKVEVSQDPFFDAPLFEDVEIIEEVIEIAADAVAVISELSGTERPTNEKLSLELLGETKFKGGDRRTVNIMVCRGTARKVVSNVQIMIKVLGSSFRPVIFHARTDANGLANVHLQLPNFTAGRAALLVRAIIENDEIELRRAVSPG